MKTKEKPKTTGHLTSATMLLTKPFKMNLDNLDINTLNIMVGQNGSGKSFSLVSMWVFGYVASAIILSRPTGDALKEIVQFTIDHSFDSKDITGTMGAIFESGAVLNIHLNEGKITSVTHDGFDSLNTPTPCKFLSSAMRTFESISMYLKFRKIHESLGPEAMTMEMLKTFKLYDVMQVESMIVRCPMKIEPKISESLHNLGVEGEWKSLDVDLEKGDFFMMEGNPEVKKYLSIMSKGHQSLANMVLAQA